MELKELETLISTSSKEKPIKKDYSAYGVLDNMEFSKKELFDAVKIMHEIVMELNSDDRDSKYLFDQGLLKSKKIYLETRENYNDFSQREKKEFDQMEEKFGEKLKNLEPLVKFIIKMKEVI